MYRISVEHVPNGDEDRAILLDVLLIAEPKRHAYAYAYTSVTGVKQGMIREHKQPLWELIRRVLRDETHETNTVTNRLAQRAIDYI